MKKHYKNIKSNELHQRIYVIIFKTLQYITIFKRLYIYSFKTLQYITNCKLRYIKYRRSIDTPRYI